MSVRKRDGGSPLFIVSFSVQTTQVRRLCACQVVPGLPSRTWGRHRRLSSIVVLFFVVWVGVG